MNKQNIIEALQKVIEEIAAEPVEEIVAAPEPLEPTPEMISEAVSGNPRLYIEQPELYAKMERFYDEKREPFTTNSWQRVVMGFGDSRPWKPEEWKGIKVRRHPHQAAMSDWYAIARGYVWDEDGQWYKRVTAEDGITEAEAMMYFETCPMDGLNTRGWPRRYRDSYEDRGW